METNKLGHKILRKVGQFQLCEDNSAEYPTWYLENEILTKYTKGKGISYNLDEDKKKEFMMIGDDSFVSRAKRRTGNDINTLEVAKGLWEELGDVPVNEDDELDEDFNALGMVFHKGEDKFDVWHWFESFFNISVAKDLMNLD